MKRKRRPDTARTKRCSKTATPLWPAVFLFVERTTEHARKNYAAPSDTALRATEIRCALRHKAFVSGPNALCDGARRVLDFRSVLCLEEQGALDIPSDRCDGAPRGWGFQSARRLKEQDDAHCQKRRVP
jgi:hypothetical protein